MVQKGSYQLWCHPLRMQLPAQSPGSCLNPLIPSGPLSLRPSTAGCKLRARSRALRLCWYPGLTPESRKARQSSRSFLSSEAVSHVFVFLATHSNLLREKELEGTLAPLT